MQRTLAGVAVLLAAGLAHAEGLEWVARDAAATAVAGGNEGGIAFHVCRASLASGAVVPGKFWTSGASGGECHVAIGGAAQAVAEFQVLAEKAGTDAAYAWVPGQATGFPLRSVIGGSGAEAQRLLVCAAVHAADGSVHPGYIDDENCVYAKDGAQLAAEKYLVLVSNDATVKTTDSAQPAAGGFDPGAILAVEGVAALCAAKDGACVPTLPASF